MDSLYKENFKSINIIATLQNYGLMHVSFDCKGEEQKTKNKNIWSLWEGIHFLFDINFTIIIKCTKKTKKDIKYYRNLKKNK